MTSQATSPRLLWALAAFGACVGFFYLANVLAADVRYPLAIFCCVVSFLCFVAGVFLLSPRLGACLVCIVLWVADLVLGAL
jgi:hypothetical protein